MTDFCSVLLIVKLTKCVILVKVILVIFDFEKCFYRLKIVYINNIYYLYILSLELFSHQKSNLTKMTLTKMTQISPMKEA